MIRRPLRVFTGLWPLLVAVAFLRAAEPAEPPPATVQFIALSALPGVWIDDGSPRPERLSASPNRFSPPRPVPAGGRLELYREEPAETPGQPPRRVPVAQTRVSTEPGANTLVVLHQPNRAAEPRWPADRPKVTLLDIRLPTHGPGSVRAVNLGTRPIGLKIDGKPARLEPGASLVSAPLTGAKPWLQAAVLGGGGWQRVIGGPVRVREGERLTVFFLDPLPIDGDPFPFGTQMRKVADRPPPVAE
ncbi:MAG: hypothetical protein ABII82_19790 [Verrucomicrobiota bacterium]